MLHQTTFEFIWGAIRLNVALRFVTDYTLKEYEPFEAMIGASIEPTVARKPENPSVLEV